MTELYINGYRIPLDPETVIALNYQINNLYELENRQSHYSNTFKIHKCKEIQEALGLADNINSDTNIPYQKVEARVIQDGLEISFDGYIIINSVKDKYEIVFYWGNLDFFNEISDKSIRDLDLSIYNHIWKINNIYHSKIYTYINGYIYPIIDWSEDSPNAYITNANRDFNVNVIHPCVFIKTIFNKIFSEAGFTPSGNFLDTDLFKNLLLTIISEEAGEGVNLLLEMGKGVIQTPQSPVDYNFNPIPFAITENYNDQMLYVPAGGYDHTCYVAQVNGKYSFDATVYYESPNACIIKMMLGKYTTGILTDWEELVAIEQHDPNAQWLSLNDIELQAGERVAVVIQRVSGAFHFKILPNSSFNIRNAEAYKLIYNYTWDIALNLPDISQKDFVKAICQMFGLIPQTNNITKTVDFKQLSDMYKNRANAYDWTDKLDMSEDPEIVFTIGDYAQRNKMEYEEDETVLKDYGNGYIDIGNTTLEKEKILFTLPFAATQMVKRLKNLDVPRIKLRILGEIENNIEPRILILDRKNITGGNIKWFDWSDYISSSTSIPLCYFIVSGKTYNLGFNDNLITKWYPELTYLFDKSKKITALFNLNHTDIANIDMFIPVYLKQFSNYFIINKINNYIANKLTEVELIRM